MAFWTSCGRRGAVGFGGGNGGRFARGFTLVEVLVAIAIFSISALGIQALHLGMVGATNLNSQYASALELAQAELEDLRALPYSEVTSRASTATVVGTEFTISSMVSDGVPQAEMKHVMTTVSWVGHGGVTKQFSLETIYAQVRA